MKHQIQLTDRDCALITAALRMKVNHHLDAALKEGKRAKPRLIELECHELAANEYLAAIATIEQGVAA